MEHIFLEKLRFFNLFKKKFPHFIGHEISLANSQETATCPIHSQINPLYYLIIPLLKDQF